MDTSLFGEFSRRGRGPRGIPTDRLRWDLAAEGEGTVLTFTTWLGDVGHPVHQQAAGYHVCLDQLAELVATGSVSTPLHEVAVGDWEQRYEEALNPA